MTDHYTLEQAAKDVAKLPQKAPIVIMRERLEGRRSELKKALPSDINPDHFIRALTTSAQINPEIQACSWPSLWLAAMKACRDGLLPDGREGAIVPFKSQAQWLPMYQGLLKKFRQSGQCKWIGADVVRAGEPFEHYVDEHGEHFKHVPGDDDAAPVTRIYAAALTKDGAFYVAILTMAEIEKIKKMSRASREDSPWKQWPGEMMKKTALRRLAKLLPSGSDIADEDEPLAVTDAPSIVAVAPPRPASAADALNDFANAPPGGAPSPDDITAREQDAGGQSGAHAAPDDAAGVSPSDDPIEAAYQHGKQSKADGVSRRAMPGEYRGDDRSREAMAWQAGHDGKSKPEFAP